MSLLRSRNRDRKLLMPRILLILLRLGTLEYAIAVYADMYVLGDFQYEDIIDLIYRHYSSVDSACRYDMASAYD